MNHKDNTIETQAAYYADMIVRHGKRHLVFYPMRKSARAATNVFRREVLRRLVPVNVPAIGTLKQHLAALEQAAIDAGYFIHEVNAADYDSTQYKQEIARQLRESGNSKGRVYPRSLLIRDSVQPVLA